MWTATHLLLPLQRDLLITHLSASSAQGTLAVNEIATYAATYTINQQAVDSGSVLSNTVVATVRGAGQSNNVTDTSDDGVDGDGNTTDDATITSVPHHRHR